MRFVRIVGAYKKSHAAYDGTILIGHIIKVKDHSWWFFAVPNVKVHQLYLGKTLVEAKRAVRSFGVVYLIHFDRPYKHARHYLGWAKSLSLRLQHHENGTGARLLQVVKAEGIGWKLARVWVGNRALEKRLKGHGSPRYCPICAANGSLTEDQSHGRQ